MDNNKKEFSLLDAYEKRRRGKKTLLDLMEAERDYTDPADAREYLRAIGMVDEFAEACRKGGYICQEDYEDIDEVLTFLATKAGFYCTGEN